MTCLCRQCWENGIILCRELADQYESYYDYRNLSKMRVGGSQREAAAAAAAAGRHLTVLCPMFPDDGGVPLR